MKRIRTRWTVIATRNISAAQWWTWRKSSPPGIVKERSRALAYAALTRSPSSGAYGPFQVVIVVLGSKFSARKTPLAISTMKL